MASPARRQHAVPDSDSAEQGEPYPNSHNPPKGTTTPVNATAETDREEPCPIACPQTKELTSEPRWNDPEIEQTEPALIMRSEDDNMGTHTPAERGEVDDTQLDEPVEQNKRSTYGCHAVSGPCRTDGAEHPGHFG